MSQQAELEKINAPASDFQHFYPPAAASNGEYLPAIIASGNPPPPPIQGGVVIVSPQQVPRGVMVEPSNWDFSRSCMICQRLQHPAGDQLSVVAFANADYSPFIRAYNCSRALLPFLLNGYYQLQWSQNHGLSAFTNQRELEQICDEVRKEQEARLNLTKRYKRVYHFLMIIGDALIIIGLIVWIMGAWPAFIAILLGVAIEMVNKWCIEYRCRLYCEQLASHLANELNLKAQNIMSRSIVITVGAYATYIRFSFPR